jgi:hypothetical protein
MASLPAPFQVNISDAALADLQARLALTRFPDELDESGWAYGTPLDDVKRLVSRWKDGFDWRAVERKINEVRPFWYKIWICSSIVDKYAHA